MSDLAIGLAIAGATLIGGLIVWAIQRLILFKTNTEEKQLANYEKSLNHYKESLKDVTDKLSELIVNFTSFYSSTMEQAKTWSDNTDKIEELKHDVQELRKDLSDLRLELEKLLSSHNHFHQVNIKDKYD